MLTDKQINAACIIFENTPITESALKAKYRELSRKYHPDIAKDDGAHMVRINRAYEILQELLSNGFTYTTTIETTTETKTTTKTTTTTTTQAKPKTTTRTRKPTVKVRVHEAEVDGKVEKVGSSYRCSIRYVDGMSVKVGKNDWIKIAGLNLNFQNKSIIIEVGNVKLMIYK